MSEGRISKYQLQPDSTQPRRHISRDKIEKKKAQLMADGQVSPILIWPVREDGKADLVDGETRWRNLPDLARWLAAEHPEADTISTRDRAHEILCTGLRLVGGWERDAFHQRTGFTVAELLPDSASALVDHGLLELSHTHIAIPAQKLLLHQGICREL